MQLKLENLENYYIYNMEVVNQICDNGNEVKFSY